MKYSFEPKVFDMVMRLEDELSYKKAKKLTRRVVTRMSQEEKQDILDREQEIEERDVEWQLENKGILMRVGFDEEEAGSLMDKRLGTPGMKKVIAMRAEEIKSAQQLKSRYDAKCQSILRELQSKARTNPRHASRLQVEARDLLEKTQGQLMDKFQELQTTLEFPEDWLEVRVPRLRELTAPQKASGPQRNKTWLEKHGLA